MMHGRGVSLFSVTVHAVQGGVLVSGARVLRKSDSVSPFYNVSCSTLFVLQSVAMLHAYHAALISNYDVVHTISFVLSTLMYLLFL